MRIIYVAFFTKLCERQKADTRKLFHNYLNNSHLYSSHLNKLDINDCYKQARKLLHRDRAERIITLDNTLFYFDTFDIRFNQMFIDKVRVLK